MNKEQNTRVKSVKHYNLIHLIYVTPQAQFWEAYHKILKKQCIIKRIKQLPQNKQDSDIIARNQISLLNSLKISGIPKCQQLIRTKTNVYLTYNQFPQRNIKETLSLEMSDPFYILKIIVLISDLLANIHKAGVVMLSISEYSIYIDDQDNVFFGDWTLAKTIGSQINIGLLKLFGELPKYIKYDSLASPSIDIFHFGKLFARFLVQIKQKLSQDVVDKLQLIINSMVNKEQDKVMDLSSVSQHLNKIIEDSSFVNLRRISSSYKDLHLNKNKFQKKTTLNYTKTQKDLLKTPAELIQSSKTILSKYHLRPFMRENNQKFDLKKTIGGNNSTKQQQLIQKQYDILLMKRQFVSFLFDMIIFSYQLNPELCVNILMLSKKSICQMESLNEKFSKSDNKIYSQIKNIIQQQLNKVNRLISSIKDRSLLAVTFQIISSIQMNTMIKKTVEKSLNNSSKIMNFQEKNEFLFKLYLLSRSIQHGSYEKFWVQGYDIKKDSKNQMFLTKDKCMGMRYFRSKIQQILQVK